MKLQKCTIQSSYDKQLLSVRPHVADWLVDNIHLKKIQQIHCFSVRFIWCIWWGR